LAEEDMISRELKIGILGGVVSSVLVIIFIQPILNFIWGSTLAFGEAIQANYIEKIYINIDIPDKDIAGNLSLGGVTFIFIMLGYKCFIRAFGGIYSQKYENIFLSITGVLMFIFFMMMFSMSVGISNLHSSVERKLVIISPKITDEELKMWRASLAKIKSKNDFDSLNKELDDRALNLKIDLN
jgi:hypothetical protein